MVVSLSADKGGHMFAAWIGACVLVLGAGIAVAVEVVRRLRLPVSNDEWGFW